MTSHNEAPANANEISNNLEAQKTNEWEWELASRWTRDGMCGSPTVGIVTLIQTLLDTSDQQHKKEMEEAVRTEKHSILTWVNVLLGYKSPEKIRELIEHDLAELEALTPHPDVPTNQQTP